MRTSLSVLALLGVTILGTNTTQANDQVFELEDLVQDFAIELADTTSNYHQIKELIAQLTKAIEDDEKAFGALVKDSIRVQELEAPALSRGHLKDLLNEYSIIGTKFQHSVMDMGATAGAVPSTLKSMTTYVKKMSALDDDVKAAKYGGIIIKRLQAVLEKFRDQTKSLEQSEAFKDLTKFLRKLESKEFDKAPLLKLAAQIATAKTNLTALEGKAQRLSKAIRHLPRKTSDADMKSACGRSGTVLKCAEAKEAYLYAEQHALKQSQDSLKRDLPLYRHSMSEIKSLHTKIPVWEAQEKKLVADKNSFEKVQRELLAVAQEMNDFRSLVKEQKASKEVLNDVQNFRDSKRESNVIEVSNEEYIAIQEYAQTTAELSGAEYAKSVTASFHRASTAVSCSKARVEIHVAKAAGSPVHALPAACK